jgi:antitoxin (DNA-binding transcriptional repressor) of toxin-antitoxin stability system
LDQLAEGEIFVITRNGRVIGRIGPVVAPEPDEQDAIMREVWQAQKKVKNVERVPNPVLQERQRRRR